MSFSEKAMKVSAGSQRRCAIVDADTPERLSAVRTLFQEYAASLSFNLCFQNFDQELARLPGEYAPPSGRLLLALVDEQPAGCVALHRCEVIDKDPGPSGEICEMKRLFVRPEYRGLGAGRELVLEVLNRAKAIGYQRIRLDTVVSEMKAAVELYRRLGFVEIAPYRVNPMPDTKYLELDLERWSGS